MTSTRLILDCSLWLLNHSHYTIAPIIDDFKGLVQLFVESGELFGDESLREVLQVSSLQVCAYYHCEAATMLNEAEHTSNSISRCNLEKSGNARDITSALSATLDKLQELFVPTHVFRHPITRRISCCNRELTDKLGRRRQREKPGNMVSVFLIPLQIFLF